MTRKEVIGELRELKHMFQRCYDKYPTCLEEAIDYIYQTPQWIPVSERLPEDSYGCIVAYHGFMMTPSGEKEYDAVYYETVGFDGQGWNNANGENIDNLIDVTAWMPLPEPYKRGDAE